MMTYVVYQVSKSFYEDDIKRMHSYKGWRVDYLKDLVKDTREKVVLYFVKKEYVSI